MSEYRVSGWASIALSATVESDGYPDNALVVEELADEIEQMDKNELRERLMRDIETTHTEKVFDT